MGEEQPNDIGTAPTLSASPELMDTMAVPVPKLDGLDNTGKRSRVFEALFGDRSKPQLLGRYVVQGTLGSGGMGTVLKAFDPTLDRRVALKVLHQEFDELHTTRLTREAQALAKLSHPNVVQVYEVGQVDGRTFVAMELVEGQSLAQWMEHDPRPGWRACVEVFVSLGAGLAAAHAEGLVHRDFKPTNAVIDGRGRPRVLDFGLARWADHDTNAEGTPNSQEPDAPPEVRTWESLTQTGTVLGTPAYMPLEQIQGHRVDARSDQFSFCVSLYEAIYGERPFEGDSLAALMTSMEHGAVRAAPRDRKVPRGLRAVVLRGLAADPEQRWPSMEALLEQLLRIVGPRNRRGVALGLTLGLAALGGGLALAEYVQVKERCTGAHAQLKGVWDDVRRQGVKTAILETALPYASDTWDRVQRHLDAYGEGWAQQYTEVCEATEVRREQSEEHRALRLRCMQGRRLHLSTTVDELLGADADVVSRAVETARSLPVLSRCADLEALEADLPPPEDPTVAERVAALEERLVQAKAKQDAGRFREGRSVADAVVVDAEELGYEPLLVRAWLRTGTLQDAVGDYEGAVATLQRAYRGAMVWGMRAEAAESSTTLMSVLAQRLRRHDEARHWSVNADPLSLATRAGPDRARYLYCDGLLAESSSKYEEAYDRYEQALAIYEDTLGSDHPSTGAVLNGLGSVSLLQGKHDDARDWHERALLVYEAALGPMHPRLSDVLGNLGNVATRQGKYGEARELHARARALSEAALGPEHPQVGSSLVNLGNVAQKEGKYDEARDHYRRALAILNDALGPEHPNVAYALQGLGEIALQFGDYDEARDWFRRSLVIWQQASGPEHAAAAKALNSLGRAARLQGRYDEAREYYRQAMALYEETLGPKHVRVAISLNNLGSVASYRHKYDEARDWHERALAIWEETLGSDHPNVAASLNNLGVIALALHDYDDARQRLERSLVLFEKTLGADHRNVAATLRNLGLAAEGQGRLDDAWDFAQRALATYERVLGPHHVELSTPLTDLGRMHLERGEPGEALSVLERAQVLRTEHGGDPADIAKTRFSLARALWAAPCAGGRDRPRARELAERARDALRELGVGWEDQLAEVEAWLPKHRLQAGGRRSGRCT